MNFEFEDPKKTSFYFEDPKKIAFHVEGITGTGIAKIPIEITENGTYNAPARKAYDPVTVNVNPPLQEKSVTENGTVTPDEEFYGLSEVEVNVPTGTARTSEDLTASGATVNVPAGLYSSAASKSVASGTEGTPTATKGAVSNHAVTVTPSVTNTEGYISGGTKTGEGITVRASELVSGTKEITANGTHDVKDFAQVSVSVSSIGTGAYYVVSEDNPDGTQSLTITDAQGDGNYDITSEDNPDGTQNIGFTDKSITPYEGDHTVTPDFSGKILETKNKIVEDDITILPIQLERTSNPQGGITIYIGGMINA